MRRLPILTLLLSLACTEKDPLAPPTPPRDAGRIPVDAGSIRDGGNVTDAGAIDAGAPMDAGTPMDAGSMDAGPNDAGQQSCGLDVPGPADRDRVVVVGQPFTATPGVDGTEVRTMTLTAAGTLLDDGVRLDVGFRPSRVEMSINGQFALVLGERGELASVEIIDTQTVALIDTVTLPSAIYGDLRIWSDGQTLFVVGSNVDTTSGISTVFLGCDGSLTQRPNEFFNVRLASSMVILPNDDRRAILQGGQAVFEPVDDDDTRLIEYTPGVGWSLVEAFDIWGDFIDGLRIDVSPDGTTLLLPNGSALSSEGNTVSVVSINGATLTEANRIANLGDAREALFSTDGQTALVTLLEPGRVAVLADQGSGWEEVDRLVGLGLAENMSIIRQGTLTDTVLVTSNDAQGEPNIAILTISGAGAASVIGMVNLGANSVDIPRGIAVQP